jgi:hypothetical protein
LPDVPTIAPCVNCTATHYKLIRRRIVGHAVIATPSPSRRAVRGCCPARWTMTACEAMTAVNKRVVPGGGTSGITIHVPTSNRSTVGASWFFTLIHDLLRPDRYGWARCFETMPSKPSLQASRRWSPRQRRCARSTGARVGALRMRCWSQPLRSSRGCGRGSRPPNSRRSSKRTNVVNLMDALRQGLPAEGTAERKKPAAPSSKHRRTPAKRPSRKKAETAGGGIGAAPRSEAQAA